MNKSRIALLGGMMAMSLSAVGGLGSIAEAGWHMDNARPSQPKPRSKSKSTHKQNARKAKRGQP